MSNKAFFLIIFFLALFLIIGGALFFFFKFRQPTLTSVEIENTSQTLQVPGRYRLPVVGNIIKKVENINVPPPKETTPPLIEVNVPRGIFVSYSNNVLIIQDKSGQEKTFQVTPEEVAFACIDEENFAAEGRTISLYDSYLNVAYFNLYRYQQLIAQEYYLEPSQLSVYSGGKDRVFYVYEGLESVVPHDVKVKVTFLGCHLTKEDVGL